VVATGATTGAFTGASVSRGPARRHPRQDSPLRRP